MNQLDTRQEKISLIFGAIIVAIVLITGAIIFFEEFGDPGDPQPEMYIEP